MNASELCLFESLVLNDTPFQKLWNDFSPSLNSTVENVEKARCIYSNALKITLYAAKEEKMMAAWLELLRQGSFTLSLKQGLLMKKIYRFLVNNFDNIPRM